MGARHRRSRAYRPSRLDAMVPWSPVAVGVGILLGYLIYALLSLAVAPLPVVAIDDGRMQEAAHPSPALVEPAPAGPTPSRSPAAPNPPVRDFLAAPASPTPAKTKTTPPAASPTPSPTPTAPAVTGRYRVEAAYPGGFIGRVVITNHSGVEQDWTVLLSFPDTVGSLTTYWVDGTPQPNLQRAGDGHLFTSTVPVPAHTKVVLRVQFERTGKQITPVVCTVNETECAIRHR